MIDLQASILCAGHHAVCCHLVLFACIVILLYWCTFHTVSCLCRAEYNIIYATFA